MEETADGTSDAIVVGGGIAGICTALALLDRDTVETFGGMFLVDTPEQRRAGGIRYFPVPNWVERLLTQVQTMSFGAGSVLRVPMPA